MDNNKEQQKKAQDIFEKMPLEKQKELKEQFPELYNALWDARKVDLNAINSFLSQVATISGTVNTYQEFEKLSLTAQIEFKNKFPEKYNLIMNLSAKVKLSDNVKTITDFEKLSLDEKLQLKKEDPQKYWKMYNQSEFPDEEFIDPYPIN